MEQPKRTKIEHRNGEKEITLKNYNFFLVSFQVLMLLVGLQAAFYSLIAGVIVTGLFGLALWVHLKNTVHKIILTPKFIKTGKLLIERNQIVRLGTLTTKTSQQAYNVTRQSDKDTHVKITLKNGDKNVLFVGLSKSHKRYILYKFKKMANKV